GEEPDEDRPDHQLVEEEELREGEVGEVARRAPDLAERREDPRPEDGGDGQEGDCPPPGGGETRRGGSPPGGRPGESPGGQEGEGEGAGGPEEPLGRHARLFWR